MIPWFDRPVIYDVRARPNIVESTSGSRDLQMVSCAQTSANMWESLFGGRCRNLVINFQN